MAAVLPKLVSTIYTYLNAGGYYKTALEIKNAINISQLQLYKKLRGNLADYGPSRPKSLINFQETTVSSDSLGELYFEYALLPTNPVNIITGDGRMADVVQSLEIQYESGGSYYPVNIVPDNQYLMMKNNSVIYPANNITTERPLGRMNGLLRYEIYPNVFHAAKARVLTLPRDVDFEVIEAPGSEVPVINPNGPFIDTDFTEEKLNNLLFLTITSLGFNLSNGVLVQAGTQQEFKQL